MIDLRALSDVMDGFRPGVSAKELLRQQTADDMGHGHDIIICPDSNHVLSQALTRPSTSSVVSTKE